MTEPPLDADTALDPDSRRGAAKRHVLAALGIAVLLALPSFEIGYFLDDYHMIGLMEGWHDFEAPTLNLYASFLDFPGVPWWTAAEAETGFWRPLSSATLHLDYLAFGRWSPGWHLHSLLWLVAFVWAGALLYRWLPASVASLALLFLAIEEAHAMTAGVLCNRHALVTAVPALFGLVCYLRWRRDGWSPGRILAPLLVVLAFFFGESTIPVLAYALAYELTRDDEPWAVRLKAIAPLAGLTLGYVIAYAALDLGPRATAFYLNPLESPTAFVLGLLARIPALLSGALSTFPASLWMASDQAKVILVGVGSGVALVFALLLRGLWPGFSSEEQRALRFWLLGALGGLPALAAAPPSDRQLLIPAIGFSVVLSLVVHRLWAIRRAGSATSPWRRRSALAGAVLLVFLHTVSAGFARVQTQFGTAELGRNTVRITTQLEELAAERDDPTAPIRFLAPRLPDFFSAVYPSVIWDYRNGTGAMGVDILSMAPIEQTFVRTGDRRAELRAENAHYFQSWHEKVLRPRDGVFEPAAPMSAPGFEIEILDWDETGPTRLGFTFDASLDDPEWMLVVWGAEGFERRPMPAIGEELPIEPYAGLFGLL